MILHNALIMNRLERFIITINFDKLVRYKIGEDFFTNFANFQLIIPNINYLDKNTLFNVAYLIKKKIDSLCLNILF